MSSLWNWLKRFFGYKESTPQAEPPQQKALDKEESYSDGSERPIYGPSNAGFSKGMRSAGGPLSGGTHRL
jgi:hypothetical protein